ncbi:MAG TPA: hypothetical protein VMJ75_25160 [Candidatus Acidoferrales bacterium]|nr:hypothetical protein [Candidatus Acidoferrales bacterium]
MKLTLLLLFAGAMFAGDQPRLFYSKAFPGSVPAYVQVTLDPDGQVDYREAPDDEFPLKFKLTAAETTEVYGLAEKLDWFKHPVESGLKVAFMGTKTFRCEKGDEKHEVQFNYSEDPSARSLWDWFERMTESAQHRVDLDRAAKYDKLGVFKAVSQLGAAIEQKRLVGLEQYLPTLDRIIKNETYMHTARVRASEIAEYIRGAMPAQ